MIFCKKIKTSSPLSRGGGRTTAIIMVSTIALLFILFNVMFPSTHKVGMADKDEFMWVLKKVLTPDDIARIPNKFFKENIPGDVIKKIPPDILEEIPSRPTAR